MDLNLTPQESAFRDEVRAFIADNLPADVVRGTRLNVAAVPEPDVLAPWHRALHSRGWVAPAWPVEYGGTGWSPTQRYLFDVECARAGAPAVHPSGVRLVGPVICRFGSIAQKKRFLPRILTGEDYWCQGYSEPGAGSDLSSLTTRATRDGDHYVINGSKIWTGFAHYADWMFALVRTQDTGRKQEGISFVLIDMRSAGITVRPIRLVGGDHEVNQVFFDEVRIPCANCVGEEGAGWKYGKFLLEIERGGAMFSARLRLDLLKVIRAARALQQPEDILNDSKVQAEIAVIETDIDALEMIELEVISKLEVGGTPGSVSSLLKLRSTEIRQLVTRLGVEIAGQAGLFWEPRRPLHAFADGPVLSDRISPMVAWHLNTRAQSIYGGTSEIQRNIMARSMLGL